LNGIMIDITLPAAAVAAALTDLDREVHEVRENWSERIDDYLRNLDPPVIIGPGKPGIPWCAAALQFWLDAGAKLVGVPNPLDGVKLEAYVQSYYQFAKAGVGCRLLAGDERPRTGDIFMIWSSGLKRYAHTGLVLVPTEGKFSTVEGNSNTTGSREGVAVISKNRLIGASVRFIRYS